MPFNLPPDISFSQTILPEGYMAYIFRHKSLGELGRLVITPLGDQCQFNIEVVGDSDDPMTQTRREIIEPILKELSSKVANQVGEGKGPVQKYDTTPQQHKIASQVFPCNKCGRPTGMMIIAPQAKTAGELEDYARIMYPKVKEMNVPTWVIGYKNEIENSGELLGSSLTLKIWPKRGEAYISLSTEFNAIIDTLMSEHC